jgi:N-methylhydantoinase A
MPPAIRLAVDIGGTFTDLVAVDTVTGQVTRAKADTTPGRLEQGVLAALARSGLPAAQVAAFIHGTTVVINAVTERAGVPTALVTTAGFRDVLEIGRANRPDIYNLAYRKPEPFVPRRLRFEVAERMSYTGEVITPLGAADLAAVAAGLAGAGVRAVAVCFLHSWASPAHEQAAAAGLRARLPGVAVVASHEVSGMWREYERTSTTVLSAYVQPVVAGYLGSLESALRGAGVGGPMRAMRSNGGVASFGRAAAAPIGLLESGPVAGVTAAAQLGRRLGARHVLTLDIGGTTAKTAAVRDGEVRVEALHHIGKTAVFPGYPVQAPTVEIVEIGAGGGSVVWADRAGGLHVGPRSAGAEPGPACYGRGGTEPTLTDANLVAGRLDPDWFLGGTMPLDPGAAARALAGLGRELGTDTAGVARGVLRYAIAQMSHALRMVTLRRGHDPRDFAFVAFGGAGPLHAALLARELGIRATIIPPGPGHFSAFGMLAGELRADAVRTVVGPLAGLDLTGVLAAARAAALAELGLAGAGAASVVSRYFAELRYAGQEHTLEIPLPDPAGPGTAELVSHLQEAFGRRCQEAYAFSLDAPLEVVSVRVSVTAPARQPVPWADDRAGQESGPRPGSRPVDFDQHGGVIDTPVISRAALAAGDPVPGPCVVTEHAATTLVLPGQRARRDELGNLVIEERS